MEEQTDICNFCRRIQRYVFIHSLGGEAWAGKNNISPPHPPLFPEQVLPLLWQLSLEEEMAVPQPPVQLSVEYLWFVRSVSFQVRVSPETVAGSDLVQGVRCHQQAHCVPVLKPNSSVSFSSNQPDILIFSFLHILVGVRPGIECNFNFWPLQTSKVSRIKFGRSIWQKYVCQDNYH